MTKFTMLIQASTLGSTGGALSRSAGFTESWYTSQPYSSSLVAAATFMAQLRAALLPASSSIVGFRFQETDGVTSQASVTQPISLPGTADAATDKPQVAVQFQMNSSGGLPNRKLMVLRGIPDENTVGGAYRPTPAFRTAMTNYLSELVSHPWQWKGRNLSNTSFPILTINALGVFQLSAPSTIPTNTMVQVLRARNTVGRQKGGFYFMQSLAPLTGTLLGWNHGDTTGGRMRIQGIVFPAPAAFIIPPVGKSVAKKVGRPFDQYRGRKSVGSPG